MLRTTWQQALGRDRREQVFTVWKALENPREIIP
jgi:hypothetical protein